MRIQGQLPTLRSRQSSASSAGCFAVLILFLLPATCESHPFRRDIARPGNEAYQADDFSRAAQEYLKAQDLEPLSAELRLNLGSAYFRQDEFDKAAEEFTEAARADDPKTAASAYYNLGNSKYQGAKRTFEAGMVAGATQSQEGDPVQVYVKKLEECISNYQETLKRTPDDTDAKYNIEMIRREIKNLMRRQQDNKQQQNQQQNQDQKDQQKQDQQNQQGEQGTPTPQPMAQMPTPSPTGGSGESQNQQQQQPTAEPTQMLSISEEMARNLLDNLPEQRQRVRPKQRRASEKDW